MKKFIEYKKEVVFDALGHYKITVIKTNDMQKSIHKRDLGEHDMELTTAITVSLNTDTHQETFIFLSLRPKASTIAHEAYHAIRRMFKYYDIKMENEAVAYHLGYLVERIHE